MEGAGGNVDDPQGMKLFRDLPRTGRIARTGAIFLMTGCMLAVGGCVRTDDGTVAVARQLDVGRYWRPPSSPPQTPPVPSGTEVFPVAPTDGWSKPARPSSRKAHRHARGPAVPTKPLACRNAFEAGQRARVVCQ